MELLNLRIFAVSLILVILSSLSLAQSREDESGGKFSGYMMGDYYYNIEHHIPEIKDQDGFWFRRIYFTYDYSFNSSFSTRLRLEMNNNGDYTSAEVITPFVKDAYLEYKFSKQKAYFGIAPPPTFQLIEKFWGYRSVERTALDLQRMASSRDFGIGIKGQFDRAGKIKYHAMIGNGSGNRQEIDKGKAAMASISYWISEEIVFQLYGDYADRIGLADTYIGQAFFGYKSKTLHGGLQYSHQILEAKDLQLDDTSLRIISVFLSGNISERVKLIGRIDKMYDPNPEGNEIAYTPFDTSASFTDFIAGVDIKILKDISIIPNIQYVIYDENDEGIKPGNDIYAKLTFFWRFK